jgi:flavin-dependent dehydrogenase
VIGGGPAGASIAQRLASLGHDVCLIERDCFPRFHIGASLPSSILPLLDAIGARERVETAGFLRPERIIVWWADGAPAARAPPGPPGFHVDRGVFDLLLLQNAAAGGVKVLQPAHAMRAEQADNGDWTIHLRAAAGPQAVTARFVVDASGAGHFLPGRRRRVAAPLVALYAHWRAGAGSEIAGRVEAGENEWFWCAPLSSGKSVAVVFIDPERLSGMSRADIETTYRALLGECRLFRDAGFVDTVSTVKACDASSRHAEQAVGANFVRVGDANLSLDPLSSQGVQVAIASALQAAIVVNTLLKHPNNAPAAIAFYRDRQKEKVRQYAAKTAAFYAERAAVCDRPFWRRRAGVAGEATAPVFASGELDRSRPVGLSELAKIAPTPIICGDVIEPSRALHHDSLERPVAFLGGVELVPLLDDIGSGQPADAIVRAWSNSLPAELGWKILDWLWQRRILVPMPN